MSALMFNFLVLPYRDQYFQKKFGPAVRDLSLIDALSKSSRVQSISVVNRPVSVYERLLGKRFSRESSGRIEWIDWTSWDLLGPLTKRKWLEHCYSELTFEFVPQDGMLNVVLDFTPSSVIDYGRLNADFVWYDLIDNFTKHNRYDADEKAAVGRKYDEIGSVANLITGVSPNSLVRFPGGEVVANGIDIFPEVAGEEAVLPKYDFGFMGFITDKFDVSLIEMLSGFGYSVVIYGDCYNSSTAKKLSAIPNVDLKGRFRSDQAVKLVRTFKVGLIPYIKRMSHDESPLKLYQYLASNRPVLSSIQYEVVSDCVLTYDDCLEQTIRRSTGYLLELFADPVRRSAISQVISQKDLWSYKVDSLLTLIEGRARS